MIFTQHYLACLSHASYLVGDESTGRAVVVDPRRDIDLYLEEAAASGLTIERVIETHVHADFVSGHLERAARTGALISLGAGAEVQFPIEPLVDGARLSLGDVWLEILAAPGHTPESICIVVYARAGDEVPYGVLTGDTLFVGDVGRPDVVVSDDGDRSADVLARRLYSSLHNKLLALPDETRVFPAHGAGSACGKRLASETTSTIGEQRRSNYALQPMSADEFVAAVVDGQPERPRYFELAARGNREMRTLLDDDPLPRLAIDDVLARCAAGALLLDPREPGDFAEGHVCGAVNVGLQGRFAEWAAAVLAPDRDIVLVGDPALATEAKVRLARVGLDRTVGQLDDLATVLRERRDAVEISSRLTVDQLVSRCALEPNLQLVDVRSASEMAAGTVPGARPIPLTRLIHSLAELDPAAPVVVYCGTGYRSQVAASALVGAGFVAVSDLLGGFAAWEQAGVSMTPPASDVSLVSSSHGESRHCETPLSSWYGGVVTPTRAFFVRNHFATPLLDVATWRLHVGGLVERPLELSLADLRRMPSHTLVATLECAGNGRFAFEPAVPGEQWTLGAVSTAEWTGVPIAHVLDRARPRPAAREVVLRGADSGRVEGQDPPIRFERSLSLDDAQACDALLAYAMNGEPLPADHGHPLRLVVPGWYAVASVKWLTEISLVDTPFTGYFQADRYVYEWSKDGELVREPVRLQQIRAVITEPTGDADVRAGDVMVRGLAWSGAAPVTRVDVRVDDGPWQSTRLIGDAQRARWQPWELLTQIDAPGDVELRARATDAAGSTQPDQPRWNSLGYGGNAIHVLPIRVR